MELAFKDPSVCDLYTFGSGSTHTAGNSGYDLYLPADTVFPPGRVVHINFGVAAKTVEGSGYWLLPRSSISKTPLRMANSVGLIDPTYRGALIAALENTSDVEVSVPRGTRLVQIALPSLQPFRIEFVSDLDPTARGDGGFGSTGGTFGGVNYIK